MHGLIEYHCQQHHVKMCKFLLLVVLFIAFVPGSITTISFGSKNPYAPIVIHAVLFAFLFTLICHMYWSHLQHKKMKMARRMSQAIMEEIQMEQISNIQMNQMYQQRAIDSIASKPECPCMAAGSGCPCNAAAASK